MFTHCTRFPLHRLNFHFQGIALRRKPTVRFLGIHFDERLNWKEHVRYVRQSCERRLNLLRRISATTWGADRFSILTVYKGFIRSKMEYGALVLARLSNTSLQPLNIIQNSALRLATGALRSTPVNALEVDTNIPPLYLRFRFLSLKYLSKTLSLSDNFASKKCISEDLSALSDHWKQPPFSVWSMGMLKNYKLDYLQYAPLCSHSVSSMDRALLQS